MVFGCNWPNCSKQFDDKKQYNEHLVSEHLGEQQQKAADENGTMSEQTMMVDKMDDKKQIWLPVETWVDILSCISRIELAAKSVSLTNWLFNAISRPRIDEHNKRIVPPLRFFVDGCRMFKFWHPLNGVQIPIAQVPPPINILGFERLTFRYIDDQILEFMRLIKPILGTNVCLDERCNFHSISNCVHQLCNIIKGNVSKLVTYPYYFNFLNMEFLKTIQFVKICPRGNALVNIERVIEWMHSPLDGNNKPRYMCMEIYEWDVKKVVEIFKNRFLESTVPVSFIFHFDNDNIHDGSTTQFSIQNHQTGEQLTNRWYHDEDGSYFFLCRSKIGNVQGWREVMRKMYYEDENENQTILRIEL